MKKILSILFLVAFVFSNIGCSPKSENSNKQNNNLSTPATTPLVQTKQNNAEVRPDEPVPTFTDAVTAFTEGNRYFDSDTTEKAIEAFKQAIKLNPDFAEAYFQLGVAYALIENEDNEDVKINEPETSKTNKKIGNKKESEKAFEGAVKTYLKILVENPSDDRAQFNLARSYNKLNLDKEAEKAIRQTVKLKPEDSQYQTELGKILVKLAKYGEAVGVLKKALILDESNSQAEEFLEKAEAGKKRQDYGVPKEKPKATKPDPSLSPEQPGVEKPEVSLPKETPKKEN